MSAVLEVSEGAIKTHWQMFSRELAKIEPTCLPQTEVAGNFVSDLAFGTMSGPAVELTERRRGGRVAALPIIFDGRHSQFWVSYREQWAFAGRERYHYRSADLTFFQGQSGEAKQQLFRAEWPGFADWGAGAVGWQAPGAGHPHWQFDALENYVSAEARRAEVDRLVSILRAPGEELEEFGEEDVVTATELSMEAGPDIRWTGMHFASQARWSKQAWYGNPEDLSAHTTAPANPKEIRDWAVSVLAYAHHELRRLGRPGRR